MMTNVQLRETVARNVEGTWVNGPRYGQEAPKDVEVRYILKRTSDGLWRVAIRGFNEGEALKAVVGGDLKVYAEVEGMYYAAVDNVFDQLTPVAEEEIERYADLLRQPRNGVDLLVEVLEHERLGDWEIWSPGPPDDYYPFDRFNYTDPMAGTINYRKWDEGQQIHIYTEPTVVQIRRNGPEYTFIPKKERPIGQLVVSSLVDRTTRTPVGVRRIPKPE